MRIHAILAALACLALLGVGLVACVPVTPGAPSATPTRTPAPTQPAFMPPDAPGTLTGGVSAGSVLPTPYAGPIASAWTPPPPQPGLTLVNWARASYSMDQDRTQNFNVDPGNTVVIVLSTTAKSVSIDVKTPSGSAILSGTVAANPGGAYTDLNVMDPDQATTGIGSFTFTATTGGTYSLVIHGTGAGAGSGNSATVWVEVWAAMAVQTG
jgi:hypothetical protein